MEIIVPLVKKGVIKSTTLFFEVFGKKIIQNGRQKAKCEKCCQFHVIVMLISSVDDLS